MIEINVKNFNRFGFSGWTGDSDVTSLPDQVGGFEIDLLPTQSHQFSRAQPMAIHHQNNSRVSDPVASRFSGGLNHRVDLIRPKIVSHGAVLFLFPGGSRPRRDSDSGPSVSGSESVAAPSRRSGTIAVGRLPRRLAHATRAPRDAPNARGHAPQGPLYRPRGTAYRSGAERIGHKKSPPEGFGCSSSRVSAPRRFVVDPAVARQA
jgi:hypothetical protein